MNELHGEYNGKVLDKAGAPRTLEQLATRSTYPEHRIIAKDMVWDLTAMRPGSRMPSLRLTDMKGNEVQLDSLLKGPVLIAFTAAWCTYCEVEMSALESLYGEYKLISFIGIGVDPGQEALSASLRLHPKRDWTWLHAPDDGLLIGNAAPAVASPVPVVERHEPCAFARTDAESRHAGHPVPHEVGRRGGEQDQVRERAAASQASTTLRSEG